MNANELLDFMRARRSLRRYRAEPVPREWIDCILEAAIWAPSAHNRQPWRFAIIDQGATKQRLARAMGAALRRDLMADAAPIDVIDADVDRSHQRITGAPLLILLCMSLSDMDVYADEERNRHEYSMAQQSTAMAGQNMLLMAEKTGLGRLLDVRAFILPGFGRSVLELPPDWRPQGLITLGFPAQARQRNREPWATRALWR